MALDNFRTIELIWDKANKSIIKTIKTASSDTTGRYLSVKILDGGQEVTLNNAKLQLYWEHPNFNTSGTDDFNTVNNGGLFKMTFSDEMLTNIGKLTAHLVLILPDGKITSDGFPVEVIKGADDGVVVPTNGKGLVEQVANKIDKGNVTLNDLTQEVKEALTGGAVAVVGENAVSTENILDGATTIQKIEKGIRDKIGDIFPKKKNEWSANRLTTTIGKKDTMGTVTYQSDRDLLQNVTGGGMYSDLIYINDTKLMIEHATDTWVIAILQYDVNKNFISDSGWLLASLAFEFTLDTTTRYVRFATKKRDNSRFYVSEIETADVLTLPKSGQKYDFRFESLKKEIDVLSSKGVNDNLWVQDLKNWVSGSWNGTTVVYPVIDTSTTRVACEKRIPVKPNTNLVLKNEDTSYNIAILQLNKEGKTILNSEWITTGEYKFITTGFTNEIVISVKKSNNSIMFVGELEKFNVKLEVSETPTNYTLNPVETTNILNKAKEVSNDSIVSHLTQKDWEIGSWYAQGGVGGYLAGGTQSNRLRLKKQSHFFVKPNTTYIATINNQRDFLRAVFLHLKDDNGNDRIAHDSGYKNGIYKFTTGLDTTKIAMMIKRQDDGAISVADFDNISIDIREIKEQPKEYKTNLFTPSKIRYFAHRGLSSVAPENTIPAVIEAYKAGYWGSECDVGLTADNELILMHDATVDRTTNGTGNYADMTLAEIKALTIDVGANIANYPDLKVPTFEEYLLACKQYGIVPVVDFNRANTFAECEIFYKKVKEMGFEEKIIVIASNFEILQMFRKLTRKMYLQYISHYVTGKYVDEAYGLDNCGLVLNQSYSTDDDIEWIKYAHSKGVVVGAYTVNDTMVRNSLIQRGVDCITTDGISF